MGKLFYALVACINFSMFAGCVYFVASRGLALDSGWTPVELVTIVLTALAVLITVLGIFIAALAIWGYTRLAEEARNVARNQVGLIAPLLVREEVTRQIGSGNYGEAAGKDKGTEGSDAPSDGKNKH